VALGRPAARPQVHPQHPSGHQQVRGTTGAMDGAFLQFGMKDTTPDANAEIQAE